MIGIGFSDGNAIEIDFPSCVGKSIGYALINYVPTTINEPNQGETYDPYSDPTNAGKSDEEIIIEMFRRAGNRRIINAREDTFKKLLFGFYELCRNEKRRYSEQLFCAIMGIYGFHVPQQVIKYGAFDPITGAFNEIQQFSTWKYDINKIVEDIRKVIQLHDTQTLGIIRVYDCDPKQKDDLAQRINYYIAVAYELVRQRYFVNRCENCGKWFIAVSKSDIKYCDRISPQYDTKNCREAMVYIKQLKREQNNEAYKLYKSRYNVLYRKYGSSSPQVNEFIITANNWKDEIKLGNESESEYIEWLREQKERR